MCSQDPRDAVEEASSALWGLRSLLSQQPNGETIGAHGVAALLGIIHDRLEPAVDALQGYVPRDWTPPAA